MKKHIVNVSVTRNTRTVSIIDSQVRVDNHPARSLSDVSALLTKPLIVQLYNDAVKQVEKLPKGFLKGLSFDALVIESKRLTDIRLTLHSIRNLNEGESSGYRKGKSLSEKTGEQLSTLFHNVFYASAYRDQDKFSLPQKSTLKIVSNKYIGHDIGHWDFEDCYKPVTDDNSAADKLASEYQSFPFEKYVTKILAKKIRDTAKEVYDDHCEQVENLNKFKEIAGNDLVNWGPHKFASQSKKHKIESTYRIQCWADSIKEHLLKSGVKAKTKEQKATSAQKLDAKYSADADGLTQDEYVQLFKNEKDGDHIISHLTADTAVSLLDIQTKNVQSKLVSYSYYKNYLLESGLKAIAKKVAETKNVPAFKKLLAYYKTKHVSYVDWDLVKTYAGHYSTRQLLNWIDDGSNSFDHTHFTDGFFKNVLSKIPADKQLKINEAVTDAFIERLTDSERSEFLRTYRNLPKVLKRLDQEHGEYAEISWGFSANRFHGLPYQEILDFVTEVDPNDGTVTYTEELSYFSECVYTQKDTTTAINVLISEPGRVEYRHYGDDDLYYSGFFNLLTFNQKVKVFEKSSAHFDVEEVFNAKDRAKIAELALLSKKLSGYLNDLPVKSLNKNIADTGNKSIYVPLTYTISDKLSRASVIKLLRCDGLYVSESNYGYRGYRSNRSNYEKKKIYSKITRKDWDSAHSEHITESEDIIYLAHLLTQDEIQGVSLGDKDFLIKHLDLISTDCLVLRYGDKDKKKNIIGDCRKPKNQAFGKALEKRLAE